DTYLIDAKKRDLFSKNPLMSNKLIEVIASSLKNNEQILLFLNRRGTAKLVLCSNDTCDWQATCPSCDLPMTYHHDLYTLLCHTCGKKIKMPNSCPKCSSKTDMKSLGSKAIYEDIKSLFPEADIGRYDSDKSDKNSFIEDYEQIRTGKINILIGTQQIIKGLDLPKLTTIGILNADLSLNFPDFSSDERTFQLITQALGRVGRGHTKSKIVVQTFQPTSAIVNKALSEDWHAFKDAEIKSRAEHNFPPFSFYAKVIFRAKSEKQIIKKAELCKSDLSSNKNIVVEGPIPSFYAKRGDFYYYQLIVRSRSRNYLLQALKKCSKDTIIDLDPLTLL
ncbi:MAG: primosomal protein N', partial [Candidatus Saccharibacteria bacterium]|nr:primosomal protein N' [Candidatus Saccharibacteria bacterium]